MVSCTHVSKSYLCLYLFMDIKIFLDNPSIYVCLSIIVNVLVTSINGYSLHVATLHTLCYILTTRQYLLIPVYLQILFLESCERSCDLYDWPCLSCFGCIFPQTINSLWSPVSFEVIHVLSVLYEAMNCFIYTVLSCNWVLIFRLFCFLLSCDPALTVPVLLPAAAAAAAMAAPGTLRCIVYTCSNCLWPGWTYSTYRGHPVQSGLLRLHAAHIRHSSQ